MAKYTYLLISRRTREVSTLPVLVANSGQCRVKDTCLKFPKLIVGHSEFSYRRQFYRPEWAQTRISKKFHLKAVSYQVFDNYNASTECSFQSHEFKEVFTTCTYFWANLQTRYKLTNY